MTILIITAASTGLQIFDDLTPITVINVIAALIVFVSVLDKIYKWITKKGDLFFTFRKKRNDMETTVEMDHTRLDRLEETMRKESAAMKEILKSQLMDRHDIFMSRKPQPYITKYERAVYMTTYQLYNDIDKDPIIDQFYRDILELPLHE